jgi:2-pyrone-4,6-dicarboxylate lactonase
MMQQAGAVPILPQGAVDTHFHLFGPATCYPYATGRSYTPDDASLAAYLAMAQNLGIARAVIVQPSPYGTDNRRLLDGLAQSPIPMRGVVAVKADVTDATLAAMHEAGVRAIRINLVFDAAAAVQTASDLAPRLRELGWHIQFLVDVSTWPDLAHTAGRLDLPMVFDHLGHVPADLGTANVGFQAMLALMREGRAWVKASGTYRMTKGHEQVPYSDVRPFFDAVVQANPDHVLWATDWPHSAIRLPTPDDAALSAMSLDWLGPDDGLLSKVFVENARRLRLMSLNRNIEVPGAMPAVARSTRGNRRDETSISVVSPLVILKEKAPATDGLSSRA